MSTKSKNGRVEWVSILGRQTVIELVDKVDNENNLGEMDAVNSKIKIKKGLSVEATRRVRIHEKMHALLRYSGIAAGLPNEIEEMICDLMESGYLVFRDEVLEEEKA